MWKNVTQISDEQSKLSRRNQVGYYSNKALGFNSLGGRLQSQLATDCSEKCLFVPISYSPVTWNRLLSPAEYQANVEKIKELVTSIFFLF
jgi:hypothetical protein